MTQFDWAFLDLETTGLKPELDKIIEVAAISLTKDGKQEVFSKLINPGMSIPAAITRLTGIQDSDLLGAPVFLEIKNDLMQFIGSKTLVAHNAGFDTAFLEAALGHPLANLSIDTLELTKLLFPGLTAYSLRYLMRVFSLEVGSSHRAMPDTEAVRRLFLFLLAELRRLPLQALREISFCLQHYHNGLTLLLDGIINEKIKSYDYQQPVHTAEERMWPENADRGAAGSVKWDIAELEKMFLPGGCVAKGMDVYQMRPQQIAMLKGVAKAFTRKRHLLVEAGTGVGKSLAYLAPSLVWAVAQNEKVVVATHTIALQDQLLRSDISFLRRFLGISFKAAALKGRGNYLCLQKLKAAQENISGLTWPESLFMARLCLWLWRDKSGDRDTIHLWDWELESFNQLSSSSEACLGNGCPFQGDCFYQKARQKALAADLVIVNHALLLTDLKLRESILPAYRFLIVDEAHHLEEEGTKQFGEVFSLYEFQRKLVQVQKKRNIFGKPGALYFWKQTLSTLGKEKHKEQLALIRQAEGVIAKINDTVTAIMDLVLSQNGWEAVRIHAQVEKMRWWQALSLLFSNLLLEATDVKNSLTALHNSLAENHDVLGNETYLRQIKYALALLETDHELARQFFTAREEQKVYWLEKDSYKKDLRLNITPLAIGGTLHDLLFVNKTSVVLTSATLCVDESFSFLMEQVGLPEELVDTLRIPSPFLYDEQTRLFVDTSMPDPGSTGEKGFDTAVREALEKLLKTTRGGSLVLFTSHKQMRYMFETLYEPLQQAGLELYADGINGRRHILAEELRNNSQAIVFGANTFWEGIDLPGKALKAVIIVKLPFNPPNLPLVEARSARLHEEGKDGFYHYSLPQAVIRFRQGYGRLIRTIDDWGVVVVLDSRVVQKQYGKIFISSLPNSQFIAGDTPTIAQKIGQWFVDNTAKC